MVKLISITKPVIQEKQLTAEDLIVYTARVSNPSNQLNTDTSEKLISYLIANKHWSPFEMVDMCVEIKTSRAIAAQIIRHRSFSFQEFSQRYSNAEQVGPIELRMKAEKNRQSSLSPIQGNKGVVMNDLVGKHIEQAQTLYKLLLENGVARECARGVLPLATQTTMYMKGSVRSWIHYLQIRTDEHTQLEHREIAAHIMDIFKSQFPNIHKSLGL
jgi:thymidylate synthase (FAD)